MLSGKNPPESAPSLVNDYLVSLFWHAGRILIFRYTPEELRSISPRHAVGLTAIGVSVVMTCTHYSPGSTYASTPGLCAIFAIVVALTLRTFGIHAVAGFAAFLITTEPVSLLVRVLPMGEQLGSAFSLWCFAALSFFGYTCAKSKLESSR